MLIVRGVEIPFDITSPSDVKRFDEAGKNMEIKAETLEYPVQKAPGDEEFMDAYIAFLNMELNLFGNFIDDAFGDGIADQLLGENPSLTEVLKINDEISLAVNAAGEEFGIQMKKYSPDKARGNREQRRKK